MLTAARVSGYGNYHLAINSRIGAESTSVTAADLKEVLGQEPHRTISDVLESSISYPHLWLYYSALSLWMTASSYFVSDPVIQLRSFSVFFSLLIFPAFIFLLRELGKHSSRAPFESECFCPQVFVLLSLVSISPFHIRYATEARNYTLFMFLTLLASGLLLRAIRSNTGRDWSWYCFVSFLGFSTHLLYVFVALSHFVTCLAWRLIEREGFVGRLRAAFVSLFVAVLPVLPWIYMAPSSRYANAQFSQQALSIEKHLEYSFNAFASYFVDIPNGSNVLLSMLIVTVALLALISFCKLLELRLAVFVLSLAGFTLLLFGGLDIVFEGRRLTVPRYFSPVCLVLELCLAFYLLPRKLLFGVFIFAGTVSSVLCSLDFGHHKGGAGRSMFVPMAAQINQQNKPVLIHSMKNEFLLSFSTLLSDDVLIKDGLVALGKPEKIGTTRTLLCSPDTAVFFVSDGTIDTKAISRHTGIDFLPMHASEELTFMRLGVQECGNRDLNFST